MLCSEVAGEGKQQKVLADLISGEKVLVEKLQKQQKLLKTHIDQQREVLSQQQTTLNQLLSNLRCLNPPTISNER